MHWISGVCVFRMHSKFPVRWTGEFRVYAKYNERGSSRVNEIQRKGTSSESDELRVYTKISEKGVGVNQKCRQRGISSVCKIQRKGNFKCMRNTTKGKLRESEIQQKGNFECIWNTAKGEFWVYAKYNEMGSLSVCEIQRRGTSSESKIQRVNTKYSERGISSESKIQQKGNFRCMRNTVKEEVWVYAKYNRKETLSESEFQRKGNFGWI